MVAPSSAPVQFSLEQIESLLTAAGVFIEYNTAASAAFGSGEYEPPEELSEAIELLEQMRSLATGTLDVKGVLEAPQTSLRDIENPDITIVIPDNGTEFPKVG